MKILRTFKAVIQSSRWPHLTSHMAPSIFFDRLDRCSGGIDSESFSAIGAEEKTLKYSSRPKASASFLTVYDDSSKDEYVNLVALNK